MSNDKKSGPPDKGLYHGSEPEFTERVKKHLKNKKEGHTIKSNIDYPA